MKALRFIPLCLIVVSLFALFVGCAPAVSKPSNITLEGALTQVRDGIQLLQQKPKDGKPAGLLISEVQVTFNITASTTNSDKICLDLSPAGLPVPLPKGSVESKSESTLNRGNQITFKFQNLFLANKETLIGMSVAPITLTEETKMNTKKDEESFETKKPRAYQPMTLEKIFKLLDERIAITFTGNESNSEGKNEAPSGSGNGVLPPRQPAK